MQTYLKQFKKLENSIKRLIDKKEQYQSVAFKVNPTWSDMPKGSNDENPREAAICDMMDCEREINLLIDQLHDLRQEVNEYIKETGDKSLQEIVKIEK